MLSQARDYLRAIGSRGGKKSRRTLSPEQARDMVRKREEKRAAKQVAEEQQNNQQQRHAAGAKPKRCQKCEYEYGAKNSPCVGCTADRSGTASA